MDIVEAFVFLTVFIMLYGVMMILGYVLDKLLRNLFGFGIFPENYFKRGAK